MNKKYEIKYSPYFEIDLLNASVYISEILQNPNAANRLIDKTEKAIIERSKNPLGFEIYKSRKNRCDPWLHSYI